MSALLVETKDCVTKVQLNRPEVRNAFDDSLIAEIKRVFSNIEGRAVVLSGSGKVFCAGGDLQWMQRSIDFTEEENVVDATRLAEMFEAIDSCPVPVIAKVHGAAFGGGLGLVAVSDIVIAVAGTNFCFSEVKLGLGPAVIAPYALRKIGMSQSRRYFLTAEVFDAETARRIGLVHEVVTEDEVDQKVSEIVKSVLLGGPKAQRVAKDLLRRITGVPIEDAMPSCIRAIANLRTSEEGQEGVRAFLEKRSPHWLSK